MTATRVFRIKGRQYRAAKALTLGQKVYNARGGWVYAWYVRPVDKTEPWKPVGRTLPELDRWIRQQNKGEAA